MSFQKIILSISCILIAGLSNLGFSDDWPMWRHDAAHTASTQEQLSKDLSLRWVLELPLPKSCWPSTQYRMLFDLSYEPVAMGDTLFVPSMLRDSLTAYDIETGQTKWRYYTDGPVRFAPVAWNGKVYFVSDDSHLYCLDAESGTLLWKFRGGPSDYKILGNGRLISMWPARGAPVLYEGTIYFASGIWPFMGIFIYALDAESGEIIWTNSGSGSNFILQPHNSPAFAGVAPQGYLAATKDKLLVASGRSVPAVYDRRTGKFLYFQTVTKHGNYEILVGKNWFFNDGIMYELKHGRRVTGSNASIISDNLMIGIDPKGRIRGSSLQQTQKEYRDRRGSLQKRLEFPVLWEIKNSFKKLFIKAGSRLYCGGPGLVAALEIPSGYPKGASNISWQTKIEGDPWTMLAANGKLFVVTKEGRIYCFGANNTQTTLPQENNDQPSKAWPVASATRAKEILVSANVREGYCLVLGLESGQVVEDLVRESNLHVIGLDRDAKKVESLRRRFDTEGLYGERLALLNGDIFSIPISPYFASLLVVQNGKTAGYGRDGFMERVFRVLHPYGGVAYFPAALDRNKGNIVEGDLLKEIRDKQLPNGTLKKTKEAIILKRAGPLPGAGKWTHQYGNVANTVSSNDRLVKPPLGLLWFGGPSNADVLPRHGHGPPQQIVGGRLFIEGIGVLSARDVYTGRVLWRKPLPQLNTFDMYYNKSYVPNPYDRTYNQRHIPGANMYGSNFVATRDRIYVAEGKNCIVLDARTGETLCKWILPPKPNIETPNWGYIGVYKNYLIAGAAPFRVSTENGKSIVIPNNRFAVGSQYLVVMDRRTGEVLWDRKAVYNFRHNSIVAGNGKLFCIDHLSQQRMDILKRRGIQFTTRPAILALDIRTGKELWRVKENIFGAWLGYSEEYDILLEAGSRAGDRARDEVDHGMAAYKGLTGALVWKTDMRYSGPCILHHDRIITQTGGGTQSASATKAYSLLTGKPTQTFHPLTGEQIPWEWVRFKGCNTAIASEYILTFRSASASYVDLSSTPGTVSIGGFRSGCTSNLIAADGVLNAPDYTRTCTCSYQNQTSLALVHMSPDDPENPRVEEWSFDYYPTPEKPAPVKRVGINFGAPGNHSAPDGALWLEFPSVGGPSPDIPITIESEHPKLFRYHMSRINRKTDLKTPPSAAWIVASGIEGKARITIRPFLQPRKPGSNGRVYAFEKHTVPNQLFQKPGPVFGSHKTPWPYTIRLYFAELHDLQPGERVFDVSIQGKKILNNFDIVKAARGPNRAIVKEFHDIRVKNDLVIDLQPSRRSGSYMPVLCGIEIVAER